MRTVPLAALLFVACTPRAPTHGVVGGAARAPADPVGTSAPGAPCAGDDDCAKGERCFAPDFSPGGGARPECETDDACGDGAVCGDGSCNPRCTSGGCGPAARCADDGHCRPRRCDEPDGVACPRNHRCDAASGACQRVACTSSSACDEGSCWQGWCYARPGYCMPAAYCCPP